MTKSKEKRMSRTVSDGFKDRLSGWIDEELSAIGGKNYRKLEYTLNQRLGRQAFSHTELNNWHNRKLAQSPTDPKLADVGIAKGLSKEPDEALILAKRWLHGMDDKNNTQTAQKEGCDPPTYGSNFKDKISVTEKSDLLSLVAQAPIEWMPDILRTLANRWDLQQTPILATVPVSVVTASPFTDMHVAQFLDLLLRENGVDPTSDADLVRFIGVTHFDLGKLKECLSGRMPTEIEWGSIAAALNDLKGVGVSEGYSEQGLQRALREFCQQNTNTNHTQHV